MKSSLQRVVSTAKCVRSTRFLSTSKVVRQLSKEKGKPISYPPPPSTVQIPKFEGLNYNPSEEERRQEAHERAVSKTIMAVAAVVGAYFGWKWYGPPAESDEEIRRQLAEMQKKKKAEAMAAVKEEDNAGKQAGKKGKSAVSGVSFAEQTPGLFVWGDNDGHLIKNSYNTDSETPKLVRSPVRIRYFEGKLLRDVSLGEGSGAAILDNGDIVQWGDRFSPHSVKSPEITLQGKDAIKIIQSQNMLYALSKDGTVYSFPVSKELQDSGPKEKENRTRLIPGWKKEAKITYRQLDFDSPLGLTEKLTDISAGKNHLLALSSQGRVFVSSTGGSIEVEETETEPTETPSAGQFGIAKFSHFSSAPQPGTFHEIRSFRNTAITNIAAGAFHSLARDQNGSLWVFGSNRCGQLGLDYAYESQNVSLPRQLTLNRVCKKDQTAIVTRVFAGGDSSYAGIKVVQSDEYNSASKSERNKTLQDTAEVIYSFGDGLKGQLGNGTFKHVQAELVPVKEINFASEWDEKLNKIVPIQVNYLSAGSNHVAAVLDNSNEIATGQDLYIWGGNEFSQIGNGKRNNIPKPSHLITKHTTDTDPYTQLMAKTKINGVDVQQKISTGEGTTCVFYKRA